MSYLEVPGASLYYEVAGQGPMLLCITGAIGNVEPFRGLAECLKDYFTVVLYDRAFSVVSAALLRELLLIYI